MESEKKDVAMWVMELEAKVQALEAERDALRELVKTSFEEGYENGMLSGTGEPFKLMHQEMMYEEWCGSEARKALGGGDE